MPWLFDPEVDGRNFAILTTRFYAFWAAPFLAVPLLARAVGPAHLWPYSVYRRGATIDAVVLGVDPIGTAFLSGLAAVLKRHLFHLACLRAVRCAFSTTVFDDLSQILFHRFGKRGHLGLFVLPRIEFEPFFEVTVVNAKYAITLGLGDDVARA